MGAKVKRLTIGDNGEVLARFDDIGFVKRDGIIFIRDVFNSCSVQDFRFHEDDWVIAFEDSVEEQTFCL